MKTKLRAIGGYGLVIDAKILTRLRISPETDLAISTDGRRIIITPVKDGAPFTTKLTAIGDGHGVIVDAQILERLQISSDTQLDISTDGPSVVVTPTSKPIEHRPPLLPWNPIRPTPAPRRREQKVRLPKKQPW